MNTEKVKIWKKGGAKRITQRLKKIREMPLSKEVFRMIKAGLQK